MAQTTLTNESTKYVQSKVRETETYLKKELEVLETIRDYEIAGDFLQQLPNRIELFIQRAAPNTEVEGITPNVKEYFQQERRTYLEGITVELKRLSSIYGRTGYSFQGSLSKCLKDLSREAKQILEPKIG